MGLFDFLKPKTKVNNNPVAYTQTGATPRFSKFGDNIYRYDTVQQAINAIAKEMKKLDPQHIRVKGQTRQVVNGDINKILHAPNEHMTTSDFIEKIIWLLYLNFNCYIYPSYEIEEDENGRLFKRYTGLYPLNPMEVTYYEDRNGNALWIEMKFAGNKELTVPYHNLIHLRLNYGLNEYEGGDKYGRPNNEALLQTLKINHKLLESVGKSIETSYSVNGIVKYNTMLGGDKVEAAIAKFNEQLSNSESGILGLDAKSEFTPISRNVQIVSKDTLEFLDLKVLRNYGVPIEILNGTATAEQKRAFYETTLEPLIVAFNQAFTKTLFNPQKISGGNKIEFLYSTLETMTNQQKLEYATLLGERGALTNNQLLQVFGFPPYEGGDVRLMSLNFVNVEIANQYQLNNAGAKTDSEQPVSPNSNPQDNNNNNNNNDGGLENGTAEQIEDIQEDAEDIVKKPLLVGQIQSMTQIILDYQAGNYTYNQAKNMLMIGVGLSEEEAEKLLDKQDVE